MPLIHKHTVVLFALWQSSRLQSARFLSSHLTKRHSDSLSHCAKRPLACVSVTVRPASCWAELMDGRSKLGGEKQRRTRVYTLHSSGPPPCRRPEQTVSAPGVYTHRGYLAGGEDAVLCCNIQYFVFWVVCLKLDRWIAVFISCSILQASWRGFGRRDEVKGSSSMLNTNGTMHFSI